MGKSTIQKRKYESHKELLDKIDLIGLRNWSHDKEKEARGLITEYTRIFAMTNMDLGKTSLVKHSIRQMDNTLFKGLHQQIPPRMYEEVWEHVKEMLEIGAIWPFHSTLPRTFVLVCKKDGKL